MKKILSIILTLILAFTMSLEAVCATDDGGIHGSRNRA